MAHLLVEQLHFTRNELTRSLEGITDIDARKRLGSMNCISWILGHLANQEHRYWVQIAQDKNLFPDLNNQVGYGKPASTPALDDMYNAWVMITQSADDFLESLDPEKLQLNLYFKGKPLQETVGTMLMRNIYHYWYHIGESQAIRQQLGHSKLPEFVGDMTNAFYHPEK